MCEILFPEVYGDSESRVCLRSIIPHALALFEKINMQVTLKSFNFTARKIVLEAFYENDTICFVRRIVSVRVHFC